MLFNSFIFIFVFLPVTLTVFFWLGKNNKRTAAISWLVLSSLCFYGYWNFAYLFLIIFSILFNYSFGLMLGNGDNTLKRKTLLTIGIICNLSLLGYFKYTNFFIKEINELFNTSIYVEDILLPLAISFFTFQQIAYLIDAYRYETKEYNFLHYCLFVTFFPQLIAGPIVHHKEMLPQFSKKVIYYFNYEHISTGATIFTIGLFKKVVFADGIAVYATPIFNAADAGTVISFFDAWSAALSYTLQLYFDFSGYSDMAIGLAYMFGIKLPMNFNSPYKATNIIDFWRRWHITLSRFLRDYLYFALGGNKKGNTRRYINLFITMLLGGLWHGAGWTFIAWGTLHGVYLMINHGWRKFRYSILRHEEKNSIIGLLLSHSITMIAVIVSWVYFRAETFSGANSLITSMAGANGITTPENIFKPFGQATALIILLTLIATLMPNTQQILSFKKSIFRGAILKNPYTSGLISGLSFFYISTKLSSEAEFLYFNF